MENYHSPLLTDFYQLTMMQAYHNDDMNDVAVFEFFVRKLPEKRNFLLAAGLEQLLDYLENLAFHKDELAYLASLNRFNPKFIDYLSDFRFTGDVYAMPEGTVFFANEPIVQVVAPISQAQFIESRLINILHYQTLIASKAIRCVLSAPDKFLLDFGMRRAHGAEAAFLSARANYLAGFDGTATVLAGQKFNIPLYGTMAHSFIQAHLTEDIAFNSFARAFPEHIVLLLDTYDVERAARKVVQLAPKLRDNNIHIPRI